MKKSNLVSIVLVVMVVSIILLGATNTFAASDSLIDLTNTITGGGSSTTGNNTAANNTTVNNTTTNNNVLTTNNTVNNNASLPKAGLESSIGGAVLVVVLGISAVYAYNKVQYYKNI